MRAASHGDTPSALCLANHLRRLDGGELEDALTALGFYGDHHPRELLKIAREGLLPPKTLADAVSMLGDAYVDRPKAQLKLLRARRERFKSVTDRSAKPQQVIVLRSIDFSIREISQHLD